MTTISKPTLKFILAIFEQGGTPATPELARLVEMTFAGMDETTLQKAAVEAMKTVRGRITVADLQKHFDLVRVPTPDEHPSAEEAWALVPKDEDETSHMTAEMKDALYRGNVYDYLNRDDHFGAERTFKKLYDENVAKSRARGQKAVWQVTLGHDRSKRVLGLERAVSRGIISSDDAYAHDPDNQAIYLSAEKTFLLSLPPENRKALSGKIGQLDDKIKLLAAEEKEDTPWKPDYEPTEAEMSRPHVLAAAKKFGITPYEYLVRPAPAHVAAKVHAILSKEYGIDLRTMVKKQKPTFR